MMMSWIIIITNLDWPWDTFNNDDDAILNDDACNNGIAMGNNNSNGNAINYEEVTDNAEEVAAYDLAAAQVNFES